MENSRRKNPLWYAVRVKARREQAVDTHLRLRGFKTLLPVYKRHRRWSDRTKVVDAPLFPGYLFCRVDDGEGRWLPILKVPGALALVGFGARPAPIDEEEIESIHRVVESGALAEPAGYLRVGSRVRLEGGPLCGLRGILVAHKRNLKMVLSVSLLQRSIWVEVDRDWVNPLTIPWDRMIAKHGPDPA